MGGERHCESEVSCPETQHNDPGQGWNSDPEQMLVHRVSHNITSVVKALQISRRPWIANAWETGDHITHD